MSNAAPEIILGDVVTTMNNAQTEGGLWEEEANRELGPSALDAMEADAALAKVQKVFDRQESALASADRALNLACASARDDVWNLLGRPASSPDLILTFPNPLRAFFDLAAEDKPARIELVAQMLDKGKIRRIPRAHQAALAANLRAHAAKLSAVLETWKAAKTARDTQLALRDSYIRVARVHLVNLKRAYKNLGLSEADIHRVIPDRKKHPGRALPTVLPEPEEPLVPVESEVLDEPVAPAPRALVSVAPEPEAPERPPEPDEPEDASGEAA